MDYISDLADLADALELARYGYRLVRLAIDYLRRRRTRSRTPGAKIG